MTGPEGSVSERIRGNLEELGLDAVFDSLELADLSIEKFRVWARKTCGFVHGHADHPAIGPTCRCFGLRREGGPEGK